MGKNHQRKGSANIISKKISDPVSTLLELSAEKAYTYQKVANESPVPGYIIDKDAVGSGQVEVLIDGAVVHPSLISMPSIEQSTSSHLNMPVNEESSSKGVSVCPADRAQSYSLHKGINSRESVSFDAHRHPGFNAYMKNKRAKRKLTIAILLCFVFFLIELIFGILAGSLAILSDSFHLLSDIAGFVISLVALYLSEKPATHRHSFGYHRAEILGAVFSTFLIWMLTAVLVWEAIGRIMRPTPVNGPVMFWIALAGVCINVVLGLTLHEFHGHSHGHDHHDHDHHSHDHHSHLQSLVNEDGEEEGENEDESPSHHHIDHFDNINVRSAFIHVIGDLVSSIGVLISSIIICYDPSKTIVDPICTFIFSIIVLYTTWAFMKHAVEVLMEGTPTHIDALKVKRDLCALAFVKDVHDLHIWNITEGKAAIAVHIDLHEKNPMNNIPISISDYNQVLLQAQNLVCAKYGIHHATIQIENCLLSMEENDCSLEGIQLDGNQRNGRNTLHCRPDLCK